MRACEQTDDRDWVRRARLDCDAAQQPDTRVAALGQMVLDVSAGGEGLCQEHCRYAFTDLGSQIGSATTTIVSKITYEGHCTTWGAEAAVRHA